MSDELGVGSHRNPHRFALILLAIVVTVIFIRPLLFGEVFVLRDHTGYFQPLRWFTAQSLQAGELPLWNPYSASGEPWLANPQTGVFYPPTWLFVVLPFATAYMLYLLVHLWILGAGAYLLFARKASAGAALVGAVALMVCGPTLSLLDVSNNLATFAWIPLAIWCGLECKPLLGGIVLALAFLGGEPFFAAVAALLFTTVMLASSWQRLRWVAIAGVIAFCLSAIQLLPFVELLSGSDRSTGAVASEEILRDSMRPRDWLRVAVKPAISENGFDPGIAQHFIPLIYIGVTVVGFALIGWITSLRRRDTIGWTVMLLAAIVVGAGSYFAPVGNLLTSRPLTLFRYPARLVPLGAMAIVAMAVIGWNRIRPNRRWADLLLIALVLVQLLPVARPLLRSAPFTPRVVPYDAAIGRDAKILRIGSHVQDPALISGYMNLYDRRHDAMTAAPLMSARYAAFLRECADPAAVALRAESSIGYVLTRDVELPRQGYDEVASARGVRVYFARGTMPLAYAGATRAETIELGLQHARVVIDMPREGIVTLTQRAAPGWRVTVDGNAARPPSEGALFREVMVPAGRHEIVWNYRPASLLMGAAITCATLFSLLLRWFVKRPRARNFSSVRAEQQ